MRWTGWFGIVNAALFALLGTRYLFAFGWPESGIAVIYVLLAFIAQFALLGYLPLMLLLGPLAVVLPRKPGVLKRRFADRQIKRKYGLQKPLSRLVLNSTMKLSRHSFYYRGTRSPPRAALSSTLSLPELNTPSPLYFRPYQRL